MKKNNTQENIWHYAMEILKKIAMEFFMRHYQFSFISTIFSGRHEFKLTQWQFFFPTQKAVHRKKNQSEKKKLFVWHRNDENRSCFSFSRLATMVHMTSDYVSLIEFPCGSFLFFFFSLWNEKTISKIKLNCVALEFLIRFNFFLFQFEFNILN